MVELRLIDICGLRETGILGAGALNGTSIIVIGGYKTGKTSLMLNLLKLTPKCKEVNVLENEIELKTVFEYVKRKVARIWDFDGAELKNSLLVCDSVNNSNIVKALKVEGSQLMCSVKELDVNTILAIKELKKPVLVVEMNKENRKKPFVERIMLIDGLEEIKEVFSR